MASCSYLCCLVPEPLWTTEEKEKFWNVLEAYLRELVCCEMPLPIANVDFRQKKKRNSKSYRDLCRSITREYLWSGRYSLAVSFYKAILTGSSKAGCVHTETQLQDIKKIFMEKPFRGYVFYFCRDISPFTVFQQSY